MILYYAFCFIVIICGVVVIHEFGHYIIARICGVKVDVFSVGFGKKIFGKKDKNDTEWQLRILPLGGYVQMRGDENPASLNSSEEAKLDKNDKKAFYNKTLKQKFAIIVAGPLFNYILAIFIFAGVAFFHGIVFIPNIIDKVADNSPAMKSGLQSGDRIIEINGKYVDNFIEIKNELALTLKPEIFLKINRNNKISSILLKPEIKQDDSNKKNKVKYVGIVAIAPQTLKLSLINAFEYGITESYRISVTSLRALGQIITGHRSPRELGGPLKIAAHSADAANKGIMGLILFTAFISVSLGLMNLLPIPMLDGGHLFFYIIEGSIGRKLPQIAYKIMLYIGMFILGSLMLFTLINDFIGFI